MEEEIVLPTNMFIACYTIMNIEHSLNSLQTRSFMYPENLFKRMKDKYLSDMDDVVDKLIERSIDFNEEITFLA